MPLLRQRSNRLPDPLQVVAVFGVVWPCISNIEHIRAIGLQQERRRGYPSMAEGKRCHCHDRPSNGLFYVELQADEVVLFEGHPRAFITKIGPNLPIEYVIAQWIDR